MEDLDTDTPLDERDDDYDYYFKYYAHFLNRLAYFKFVPQTTIQEIVHEYITSTKKSLKRQEKSLRWILTEKGLEHDNVDCIVSELIETNPYLKAQEQLNSEYKRTKFIQEDKNCFHPQEILLNHEQVRLGHRKDVYHYVSIIDSFKCLVQDPKFIKMEQTATHVSNADEKLRDLKDGSRYQSCEYFKENRDAYTIILYSDAVECKNPLGAARGTYKVVQIYFTLSEVPKKTAISDWPVSTSGSGSVQGKIVEEVFSP